MGMDRLPGLALAVIWGGLTSPVNILGGLVLGWLCRRWWHVPVAAVVLEAAVFVTLVRWNLPAEGELVLAFLPLGLVGPLAWCAAGFALRRALAGPDGARAGGVAARIVSVAVGVVVGAAAGAGLGLLLGEAYVAWAKVSSFEGASGYLVVFGCGLPGLVIGSGLGAWLGWRLSRPH